MQAGFSKTDITPSPGTPLMGYFVKRIADGVLSPLEARAVAVSDGINTAVLASLDLAGILKADANRIREMVSKKTGLKKEAVTISATHTHTGPVMFHNDGSLPERCKAMQVGEIDEKYREELIAKVAQACVLAVEDLKDATLFAGTAQLKGVAFVRRYRMKDGSVRTNPSRKMAQSGEVLGSVAQPDETVAVVSLERGLDRIVLVNFALHADCIGGNKISADFPGFAREWVEKNVQNSHAIYFNGACGDVNHYNPFAPIGETISSEEVSREIGQKIGNAALHALKHMQNALGDGRVCAKSEVAKVLSIKVEKEEIAPAIQLMEEVLAGTYEGGLDGGAGALPRAYRVYEFSDGQREIDLEVASVRFGNVAFVGFPGEPFSAIAREVKQQSQVPHTICTHATNAYEGYFPTADAYAGNSYETRNNPFSAGVAEKLIEAAIKAMQK